MAVLLGLFVNRVLQPRVLSPAEMVENGTIIFSLPREISAFELLDHRAEPFTNDAFTGAWTLVFFGFTHCPDICPATMAQFNQLDKALADTEIVNDTRYLLVSLDPARDTPEKMASYVGFFNDKITGVTGDFLTIHRFASELNVAFQKVVTDAESGEYTVDHSGLVAIINPEGFYQGFFKPPLSVDRMALTYRSARATL